MVIENVTQKKIMVTDAALANTFFARLKGLLGTKKLDHGKGLIIRPCNSIHTVGMKYAIDIIFLDNQDKIVKLINDMPSGKFSLCSESRYVVELPAGTIEATGTTVGDKISLICDSKI